MPTLTELPQGAAAADSDLLMVSQGGQLRSVTRAQLLAGVQPEIIVSKGQVLGRAVGTGDVQALSIGPGLAMAGTTLIGVPLLPEDAVPAESFGAKGDGATDDGAALSLALASGKPVRLGARTYLVNGQWTITQPNAILLGSPGLSVLKRGAQAGNGAWIAVQADGFRADGVIFDANRAFCTKLASLKSTLMPYWPLSQARQPLTCTPAQACTHSPCASLPENSQSRSAIRPIAGSLAWMVSPLPSTSPEALRN